MTPSRHVPLRTKILLRLDHQESSDRWHGLFLTAGLLTTVSRKPEVDSPVTLLLAARDNLFDLQAAEAALHRTRAPVGGFGNHAPTWAWLVAMAVPVLSFQLTSWGESAEDQLMAFGTGMAFAGILAMIGIGWVASLELNARRRQRENIRILEERVAVLRSTLVPAARAVLSRSFVAQVGAYLVSSSPHLVWLQQAAASARRAAASHPNPDALRGLITALEAQAQAVEDALRGLRRDPPDGWSDVGLVSDLGVVREQLEELGLAPDPLCAVLDDCWS